MRSIEGIIVGLLVLTLSMAAIAADWPQFQGPDRTAKSQETGIARSWPESGPKVLWTVPLGGGFGGAAIVDGEVYVLDRVENKVDVLRCYDLITGEELWAFTCQENPDEFNYSGARGVPAIDGDFVYAVSITGDFYCISRKTHQLVWQRNFYKEYEINISWGMAQSPLIHGDMVLVSPQSGQCAVAAFNKKTGEVIWESEGLGIYTYSSPSVAVLDGVEQILMAGAFDKTGDQAPGKTAGLDPKTGKTLWTYDNWTGWFPIAHPVQVPDDRLFLSGAYEAGSAMIQVKKSENGFKVTEIFKIELCGTHIHQPFYYKDHIYINGNDNDNSNGLMCLNLKGELIWRTKDTKKLPRFERGASLMVDDLILAVDGKKGTLHLVEPSPEGYKELARAEMLDKKMPWAPMALSNGKLVLRDQTQMKCVDVVNP